MIDHEQIRSLARLASLALDETALDAVVNDLGKVLALVETLNAVDTDGIEPMAHPVSSALRLRDDVVLEGESREALQAAAPDVRDGYFIVPRVIEQDAGGRSK